MTTPKTNDVIGNTISECSAGVLYRTSILRKKQEWQVKQSKSVVRGHHVFKAVWTLLIGEELQVFPELEMSMTNELLAFSEGGSVMYTERSQGSCGSFLGTIARL